MLACHQWKKERKGKKKNEYKTIKKSVIPSQHNRIFLQINTVINKRIHLTLPLEIEDSTELNRRFDVVNPSRGS